MALLKAARQRVIGRAEGVDDLQPRSAEIAIGWGARAEWVLWSPIRRRRSRRAPSRPSPPPRLGLGFPTFVFAVASTPQKNLPLAVPALEPGSQRPSPAVVGEGPSGVQAGPADRSSRACAIGSTLDRRPPACRGDRADARRRRFQLPSDRENFLYAAGRGPGRRDARHRHRRRRRAGDRAVGRQRDPVPPRAPDALAAAMARVSEDDALRANLRAGALRASERYRKDVVYGTIEAELGRAVASKNGAPGPR